MDWKTDSDFNELDTESYSSFQSSKSGKLFDRLELPIILVGAGLLALVILFVLFIPKKNEITIDDYKHIVSRLDQLENKIDALSGKEIDIEDFDPASNPVQYQQVINWIKSNAEVISETIKKVDEIENRIQSVPGVKVVENKIPATVKKTVPKKKTDVVSSSKQSAKSSVNKKSVEKPQPVTIKKSIEKSNTVQVKTKKKATPETIQKPEQKSKAVILAEPAKTEPVKKVKPKPIPKAEPAPEKPTTVKFIFHRVEKGETLYRISRNYGISVEELQMLNDMKKDDLIIDIGQELIVKKVKQ